MISEDEIHSGPDSPHVTGSMADFWHGEWVLVYRENSRQGMIIAVQSGIIAGLLLAIIWLT